MGKYYFCAKRNCEVWIDENSRIEDCNIYGWDGNSEACHNMHPKVLTGLKMALGVARNLEENVLGNQET
jgi:hypothetical protein